MSKIKVYELAKELEVSNKEIVDFLKSKNIEVRTHMSAVDEADAEAVRKAFPKGERLQRRQRQKLLRRRILYMCSARRIHKTAVSREEDLVETDRILPREDQCR